MCHFIGAHPNTQNVACSPRVGFGNIFFAHNHEKIVMWQRLEITVKPPPVAPAKRVVLRVVHDRDRKGAEIGDQTGTQIGALVDPDQVGPALLDSLEYRTVDFQTNAERTGMMEPPRHPYRPADPFERINERHFVTQTLQSTRPQRTGYVRRTDISYSQR